MAARKGNGQYSNSLLQAWASGSLRNDSLLSTFHEHSETARQTDSQTTLRHFCPASSPPRVTHDFSRIRFINRRTTGNKQYQRRRARHATRDAIIIIPARERSRADQNHYHLDLSYQPSTYRQHVLLNAVACCQTGSLSLACARAISITSSSTAAAAAAAAVTATTISSSIPTTRGAIACEHTCRTASGQETTALARFTSTALSDWGLPPASFQSPRR